VREDLIDRWPARRVVDRLVREERKSAAAVARAAPRIARAAELVARALADGGRLLYIGAGTSGRLAALDAAECPPTFGTRPSQVVAVLAGGARAIRRAVEGAEDDERAARRAIRERRVSSRDVVIGVAASGTTPFTRAALDAARAAGAPTILVTCVRAPKIRAQLTIILDVGPEVIAGSTRLKAGTATKIALNAISTAAMVRLGHAYGPHMIDVRATNAKLRARARAMLQTIAGVDARTADRLLRASGGKVKIAVVMARLGMSSSAARAALRRAGGRLREVISP
jgi:N-acetylmuramic acid 6-phosphate etherase